MQAVQDIKAGQDMFWYGIFPPIGTAARDIAAGEIIEYDSHKSTKDVILNWEGNDEI